MLGSTHKTAKPKFLVIWNRQLKTTICLRLIYQWTCGPRPLGYCDSRGVWIFCRQIPWPLINGWLSLINLVGLLLWNSLVFNDSIHHTPWFKQAKHIGNHSWIAMCTRNTYCWLKIHLALCHHSGVFCAVSTAHQTSKNQLDWNLDKSLPSWELRYPTNGKGNSSSQLPLDGIS